MKEESTAKEWKFLLINSWHVEEKLTAKQERSFSDREADKKVLQTAGEWELICYLLSSQYRKFGQYNISQSIMISVAKVNISRGRGILVILQNHAQDFPLPLTSSLSNSLMQELTSIPNHSFLYLVNFGTYYLVLYFQLPMTTLFKRKFSRHMSLTFG